MRKTRLRRHVLFFGTILLSFGGHGCSPGEDAATRWEPEVRPGEFLLLDGRSPSTGEVVIPLVNLWDQPASLDDGARVVNKVPHGTRVQVLAVTRVDQVFYYYVRPPSGVDGWVIFRLVRREL